MLSQELLNKRNVTIHVRLGQAVKFDKIARFDDDARLIQYLRLKTDALGHRAEHCRNLGRPSASLSSPWKKPMEPVAPAANPTGQCEVISLFAKAEYPHGRSVLIRSHQALLSSMIFYIFA